MLAVSLARQSEAKAEDESLSLAFQHRRCREEAERRGDEIVATFDDLDVPGSSEYRGKRVGLHAMMAYLKSNPEVRRAYVYNISRLARDTLYALELVRDLQTSKPPVELCSTSENIEDPTILAIIAAMASRERIQLSNTIAYAVREAARRGKMVLPPPYGLHRIDGQVVPHPTQAPVVRRIFAEYAAGRTLREIVDGLKADGIPSADGQHHWRLTTISRLLTKRAYRGEIAISASRDPAGKERPSLTTSGNHERLIDEATWMSAQRRKGGNEPRRKHTAYPAPFIAGVCLCAACGNRLYLEIQRSKPDRLQPYWIARCATHRSANDRAHAIKPCPGQPLAAYHTIDRVVRQLLFDDLGSILSPQDALQRAMRETGRASIDRGAELRAIIRDTEQRIERILEDRESGDIPLPRFRTRKAALESQRDSALRELAVTLPVPEIGVITTAYATIGSIAGTIMDADTDVLRWLVTTMGATVSIDLRTKSAKWQYRAPFSWMIARLP